MPDTRKDRIGIHANSYFIDGWGIVFDPRGVAQTMRTVDLTNNKMPALQSNKRIAARLGPDSDGAFRIDNRLDGRRW